MFHKLKSSLKNVNVFPVRGNILLMKKEKDYVKSTHEGKLYITTEDFFKQPKIVETINKLKDSTIVKEINKNKNMNKDLTTI